MTSAAHSISARSDTKRRGTGLSNAIFLYGVVDLAGYGYAQGALVGVVC